jgi:hypothetical protein
MARQENFIPSHGTDRFSLRHDDRLRTQQYTSAYLGRSTTTSAPHSTTSPPRTTAASPTSSTGNSTGFGPVAKTATMHVVLRDGYEARVNAQWHIIREIQASEMFPYCRDMHGKGNKNDVIRASVVEIKATFPQVNGFEWPAEKGININADGGSLEVSACGEQPAGGSTGRSSSTLSPKNATIRIMFKQSTEKTPANPTGTPKKDFLKDANFALDDTYGTCTGTGLEDVLTKFCRMRYSP